MQKEQIKKIYSKYSPVYDVIFAQVFSPRIRLGLKRIGIKKGDTILEVGVGTGLSLPFYPDNCNVVGIDITRKMLNRAYGKKVKLGLDHVSLFEMDAENIAFSDNSFDHAVVPFVISVVPDPEKMVSEVKRVTKRNGNIVIINHFCSSNFFLSKLETFLSPLSSKIGWRYGVTTDLLSNHCNLYIEEIVKKNRLDPWRIIHAKNNK
jgi:phosphatidylethanolamine/phosphatidyl-N-methylethanolamine N-methyltransferase